MLTKLLHQAISFLTVPRPGWPVVLSNAINCPTTTAGGAAVAQTAELEQAKKTMNAMVRDIFAMRKQREAALAKLEELTLLVPAPADPAKLKPLEIAVHDAFVLDCCFHSQIKCRASLGTNAIDSNDPVHRQARLEHAEQAVQAAQAELDAAQNAALPEFVAPQKPVAETMNSNLAIAPDHIKLAWTPDEVGPYGGPTKKRASESVDDAFWHVVDEQGQSIECLAFFIC